MKVHHLNCGTLCPHGRRFFAGEGGWLEPAEFVCNCLLIESDDGLVLVDTGFGVEDVRDLGRLGPAFKLMRPRAESTRPRSSRSRRWASRPATCAGSSPPTSTPTTPAACPTSRKPRSTSSPASSRPPWTPACATARATASPTGATARIGSATRSKATTGSASRASGSCPAPEPRSSWCRSPDTRSGHSAIAIKTGERWLLHCGDAYFHHGEVATPPHCPPGLTLLPAPQRRRPRSSARANQERLRELVARHGEEIDLICSHDPHYL